MFAGLTIAYPWGLFVAAFGLGHVLLRVKKIRQLSEWDEVAEDGETRRHLAIVAASAALVTVVVLVLSLGWE